MLDYRLKVFQAVAEKLNFTRAAEHLHISQPAVTQHIKLLEDHYQTSLFHRAAGGVVLTPAGQLLLEASGRAAELERLTEKRIRNGQAVLSGALRLGSSTTVAQYFLPSLLGQFLAKHSLVELSLRIGNTREVADGVRADRFDLGLVEGPGERRALHAEDFFDDEIVCVATPDHPLVRRIPIKPADLMSARFVLREPGSGTRDVVERALKKLGVSLRSLPTILETDSSETLKGMVAGGTCVAFLSRLSIAAELAAGRLGIVNVAGLKIRREFFFLHAQGPRPAGATGAFMDFVRAGAASANRTAR